MAGTVTARTGAGAEAEAGAGAGAGAEAGATAGEVSGAGRAKGGSPLSNEPDCLHEKAERLVRAAPSLSAAPSSFGSLFLSIPPGPVGRPPLLLLRPCRLYPRFSLILT